MKKLKTKIGDSNNYLTVVGFVPANWEKKIRRKLICKCRCGNVTEVAVCKFRSGHTKSCGCYKDAQFRKRVTKHGLSEHPLYVIFNAMKARCYSTRYSNTLYQNKGIKIYDEWLNDFMTFYNWCLSNGWRKGLHLDRIDSNGNYEPSNCQFLNPKENYSKVKKEFRLRIEYKNYIQYLESLLIANNIQFNPFQQKTFIKGDL